MKDNSENNKFGNDNSENNYSGKDNSWADDVSLLYKEDHWKPDEEELTQITLDPLSFEQSSKDNSKDKNPAGLKTNTSKGSEILVVTDPTRIQKKKRFSKAKPFHIFMILWIGILLISIGIGLNYYYDYLDHYEQAYQNSRPYHKMDELLVLFINDDMDQVYELISALPVINEFETEENVKNYIRRLLVDATYSYSETENYSEDQPEYYIYANNYIIATVNLRKNPNEVLEYNFPTWYISAFQFYTDPGYECSIYTPDNCSVSINEIPLTDDYCYQRAIKIDERDYVDGYAEFPTYRKYKVDGFYEEPVITATNCYGESVAIQFNKNTGMYEVPFGEPDEATAEDMKNYAIETATAYANCISHDITTEELEAYFVPDCTILDSIKEGVRSNYFSPHDEPEILNQEIKRFDVYSKDVFVCEVSLTQHMFCYSREEFVDTDLTFYFVNTEDGWKVCNIKY